MVKATNGFKIPDPLESLNNQGFKKYEFGDLAGRINDFKSHYPVFAFDFVSLNKTEFCFNSNLINKTKDYHNLIEGLKKISKLNYDTLSIDKIFHFHEVDFNDVTFSESDLTKCLVNRAKKNNDPSIPTLYQFKVFEQARVFGFIYQYVFYLIFFDRNHNGYKRK